jgi:hypothetical protein
VHLAKKQKKTVPLIEMEKQPSFLTLYMQAGGLPSGLFILVV